jgi:hypothetical protein
VEVRFRANFAYVGGEITDGLTIPLCRLRYGGSASVWGFAVYRASHDDYEDSLLPSGRRPTAEQAAEIGHTDVPLPWPMVAGHGWRRRVAGTGGFPSSSARCWWRRR